MAFSSLARNESGGDCLAPLGRNNAEGAALGYDRGTETCNGGTHGSLASSSCANRDIAPSPPDSCIVSSDTWGLRSVFEWPERHCLWVFYSPCCFMICGVYVQTFGFTVIDRKCKLESVFPFFFNLCKESETVCPTPNVNIIKQVVHVLIFLLHEDKKWRRQRKTYLKPRV